MDSILRTRSHAARQRREGSKWSEAYWRVFFSFIWIFSHKCFTDKSCWAIFSFCYSLCVKNSLFTGRYVQACMATLELKEHKKKTCVNFYCRLSHDCIWLLFIYFLNFIFTLKMASRSFLSPLAWVCIFGLFCFSSSFFLHNLNKLSEIQIIAYPEHDGDLELHITWKTLVEHSGAEHKKSAHKTLNDFYEELLKLVELETVFNEKHTHTREKWDGER